MSRPKYSCKNKYAHTLSHSTQHHHAKICARRQSSGTTTSQTSCVGPALMINDWKKTERHTCATQKMLPVATPRAHKRDTLNMACHKNLPTCINMSEKPGTQTCWTHRSMNKQQTIPLSRKLVPDSSTRAPRGTCEPSCLSDDQPTNEPTLQRNAKKKNEYFD